MSWLSQLFSSGIFKLIVECAPRKSLIWKARARQCADGAAVMPGRPPKVGLHLHIVLCAANILQGKKEKLSPCLNEILTQSMQIINYI